MTYTKPSVERLLLVAKMDLHQHSCPAGSVYVPEKGCVKF